MPLILLSTDRNAICIIAFRPRLLQKGFCQCLPKSLHTDNSMPWV